MEAHVLLFMGFLLRICQSQGSEDKFVKLGEDLLLDLNTSVKLSESFDFLWKFKNHQLEKEVKVAKVTHDNKPSLFGKFKENSEIFQNYSLLLRKVKHNNTGTYTGLVSGEEDDAVAVYNIIVQDEVPNITLTVNGTSDPDCNLAVTCSTADSHIRSTFICDMQNCSVVDELQPGDNNIPSMKVYRLQHFIVCNYSNQVSSKQHKLDTTSYCGTKDSNGSITFVIIGVICAAICILTGAVTVALICRKCRRAAGVTEYTFPEGVNPGQNSGDGASGCSPTSTYATVQFPLAPTTTDTPRNKCQPETLYAEVNRAQKNKSEANEATA
ncbi:uncharacterized protein LOC115404895 [Salarias fasciatus]|uniref:uncharacterized protein LOC115404895 n=1 Tax=Salarias fasciatus TaxID=181472 RepID=UPI001176554A|nr:uncharacterized protein LOC115404895 [Salarias fasciatus]